MPRIYFSYLFLLNKLYSSFDDALFTYAKPSLTASLIFLPALIDPAIAVKEPSHTAGIKLIPGGKAKNLSFLVLKDSINVAKSSAFNPLTCFANPCIASIYFFAVIAG